MYIYTRKHTYVHIYVCLFVVYDAYICRDTTYIYICCLYLHRMKDKIFTRHNHVVLAFSNIGIENF